MQDLLNKAKSTHLLTKSEIVELLKSDGELLFKTANEVRKKFVGDAVHLRALIEFSNICKNNCLYCGIRRDNKNIDRYCLSKSDIIELAKTAIDQNYKTIVLQSGENCIAIELLAECIKEIKSYALFRNTDIAITLSIGELSYDEYKLLKISGADRYLLKIETTDKNLYNKMHPNMSYENRVKCLEYLKDLGYETGTGCLVGLPDQTIESLADDILFFKKINADMIGIGTLIVHNATPLSTYENGDFWLALKVMAVTRLLLPDINIPATTAMETIKEGGRIIALQSGANVIMPNLTYEDCRNKYNIYPNKISADYNVISKELASIGRTISNECILKKRV